MKKLTLDETWRLCLSMWRWIAKEKRNGSLSHVSDLKIRWLESHGFDPSDLRDECFFCEYDLRRYDIGRNQVCSRCPAKKIAEWFDCADEDHHWACSPIAFYNKLVSLNKKRLAKRKK